MQFITFVEIISVSSLGTNRTYQSLSGDASIVSECKDYRRYRRYSTLLLQLALSVFTVTLYLLRPTISVLVLTWKPSARSSKMGDVDLTIPAVE